MLGERLRFLRRQNGFTQRKIAEILNIDRSTYTYYEIGKTTPDINTIKRLASIFKVSIDYLLEYNPNNPVLNDSTDLYQTDSYKVRRSSTYSSMPGRTLSAAFSEDEQSLVLYYRTLSSDGQQKLLTRIREQSLDTKQ